MIQREEPAPILRVTAGSTVYSSDDEKLGKVKEVRGGRFKVETGLLQRDYWLSGDAVESADPDQSVFLTVAKSDIDQHKVDAPSEVA
jgi:hypothetical protein